MQVKLFKKLTFPKLYDFTFLSAMYESSSCFSFSSTFGVYSTFNFSHPSSFNLYFLDCQRLSTLLLLFKHGHPQGLSFGSFSTLSLELDLVHGVGVIVWLRFSQLSLKKWIKKFKDALYIPNSDLHKLLLMRQKCSN